MGHSKSKLIFPNLSMLDLSNNQLKDIPANINELINLSVLNISGNKGNLYNFSTKFLFLIIFLCHLFTQM